MIEKKLAKIYLHRVSSEQRIRSIVSGLSKPRGARLSCHTTAALAHISEAVVTADAFDRINFMNRAAQKLTGRRFEEVSGSRLSTTFTIVQSSTGARVAITADGNEHTENDPATFQHAVLVTQSGSSVAIEFSVAEIHELRRCVRQSDTVSRFGGDEFLVLLPEIAPSQDVAVYAQKVLRSLEPTHEIDNHELHITASVGVARFPRDALDSDSLLKCADIAMYNAKSRGGNQFQIFETNFGSSEL